VFRSKKGAKLFLSDESVIERTSRCDEYFEKLPNFVFDDQLVDENVDQLIDENVDRFGGDESTPLAFAHQVHKQAFLLNLVSMFALNNNKNIVRKISLVNYSA
jgi:hypothetical protein